VPPLKKMMKARAKLIQRDPFFGAVALGLRLKELTDYQVATSRIKTMGTDSVFLVYNLDFVEYCTIKQLMASIAHEAAHVAFKHPLRRKDRNFKLWNIACDYAINSILIEAGYDLPEGVKHNPAYNGMSSEKIYKALKQEEAVIEPEADGDEDSDSDDNDNENNDPDNDGDEDNDDDDDDNNDSDEDNDSNGGSDNNKFNPDQEGAYELPDFEDEFDPMPELPDDFSAGVVLDAPEEAKNQEAEKDLEIQAAAIAAKTAGMLPASLERIITSQHVHKVNYRDLLRDWVQKNVFPSNYTWKKPNRRYSSSDLTLPAIDSDWDLPNIGVAVDESGSVTDEESEKYANEMAGILSEFECTYTAIYFDTAVRRTKEFTIEDLPISLDVQAGGGTAFQPVFDYIRENSVEMDALLFFTDMGAYDWNKIQNPGYPVLWMNTDRNWDDRKVPFGTVIPLEMEDD